MREWRFWQESARRYDLVAPRLGLYRELNSFLVDLARPAPGERILDLGTGTGLTAGEILGRCPDVRLTGIDFSGAMLRRAARRLGPAVELRAMPAEEVGSLPAPFDLALANSAFWLFSDQAAVFRALGKILRPGGRFLFNIPDQDFRFPDGESSRLRRAVDEAFRRHGREVPTRRPPPWDREVLDRMAEAGGLQPFGFWIQEIRLSADELRSFYSLPKFTRSRLPELPYPEGRRLIRRILAEIPEPPVWRWAVLGYTRS